MAWVMLFFAGLFEIGWAIGLKYTEGFSRIGAVGTAILGIVLFGEPATAGRLTCIALIVAGILGLKVFSAT
jgi:quaternary ammonium compound-resistance protein SugE